MSSPKENVQSVNRKQAQAKRRETVQEWSKITVKVIELYLLRFKIFDLGPHALSNWWPMVLLIAYTSPTFQRDLESFSYLWNNHFYVKSFLNYFLYWGSNILLYPIWGSCVLTIVLPLYVCFILPLPFIQRTWGS